MEDSIAVPLRAGQMEVADMPQYYREGYFSSDPMFHPELPGGRYGTAGDPVPYAMSSDNVITSLLLLCFILAVIAFSGVRSFMTRQIKSFFYAPHHDGSEATETAGELRFQIFLALLTCLLLALLAYLYTAHFAGDVFVLDSQYLLIAIFLAIMVGYGLLRVLGYTLVNVILFDGKRNIQWLKSLLLITNVEGVFLFPLVVLLAYFDMSVQNAEIYFIIALVLVKIFTIYRCYTIFFRQNVVSLQIILYLCALEVIPLLSLWRVLMVTTSSLKINF